jgi:hypothetical protein
MAAVASGTSTQYLSSKSLALTCSISTICTSARKGAPKVFYSISAS